MSDTFDRSQLDGKDREQLPEIASALGVKSISRMRKADLVDAIVDRDRRRRTARVTNGAAAADARGGSARPQPATDDLASLADEENALGASDRTRARRDGADPSPPAQPTAGDERRDRTDRRARPTPRPSGTAPRRRRAGHDRADERVRRDQNAGAESPTSSAAPARPGSGGTTTAQPATAAGVAGAVATVTRRRRRSHRRPARRSRRARGPSRRERAESATTSTRGDLIDVEGLLDLRDEGYGFLRTSAATSPVATTCTSRRRRCGGSACARATT